jgi:hypothetical protein
MLVELDEVIAWIKQEGIDLASVGADNTYDVLAMMLEEHFVEKEED